MKKLWQTQNASVVRVGHKCMGVTNVPVVFFVFFFLKIVSEDSCGISTLQDTLKQICNTTLWKTFQ